MVHLEPRGVEYQPPSAEVLDAFSATPWCADLLSNRSFRAIRTRSREPKASTEDEFIAKTLASQDTISHWQSLYRPAPDDGDDNIAELCVLARLGRGLNGHPHLVHGGFLTALFDEIMTFLAGFHRAPGTEGYTAFLKVDFKKAVPSPSIVLAKAALERRSKDRKLWLRGTVEDGHGQVYAIAETLIVEVSSNKAQL